jgi:peptide/nickel transport system permease protein
MQTYLVRRVVQMIPVFIGITIVSFLMIRLSPGDPIATMYPPEVLERVNQDLLREQLGLNDPLPIQYVKMMTQFFTGDLISFQEGRSTAEAITERLPTTILFAVTSIVTAMLIGLPIAVLSATRPYSKLDNVSTIGAMMGLSLPQFWIALVFILIFSERLRLLPASGVRPLGSDGSDPLEVLPYIIMPTIVLMLGLLPSVVRYMRSSMLDVLDQDYVRTARSKGLTERVVIGKHALRNAILPVVTLIGAIFPLLLGGAVLVETIFGLPGLGRLAVRSAQVRDLPVVLSINILAAIMVLISNLVTDIVYTYLDPRIRLG